MSSFFVFVASFCFILLTLLLGVVNIYCIHAQPIELLYKSPNTVILIVIVTSVNRGGGGGITKRRIISSRAVETMNHLKVINSRLTLGN